MSRDLVYAVFTILAIAAVWALLWLVIMPAAGSGV